MRLLDFGEQVFRYFTPPEDLCQGFTRNTWLLSLTQLDTVGSFFVFLLLLFWFFFHYQCVLLLWYGLEC